MSSKFLTFMTRGTNLMSPVEKTKKKDNLILMHRIFRNMLNVFKGHNFEFSLTVFNGFNKKNKCKYRKQTDIRQFALLLNIFLHQSRKLGPPEVRKALKALGFKVKRDQVRQLVSDASIKGNGYVYLVKLPECLYFWNYNWTKTPSSPFLLPIDTHT